LTRSAREQAQVVDRSPDGIGADRVHLPQIRVFGEQAPAARNPSELALERLWLVATGETLASIKM